MQEIPVPLLAAVLGTNASVLVIGGPVSAVLNDFRFWSYGLQRRDCKVFEAAFEQPVMTTIVVGICTGAAAYLLFA